MNDDRISRFGHGSKLHVTTIQPNPKLDILSVSRGQTSVAIADATRLDDTHRRRERSGPIDPGTYTVVLFHSGPLPVKVGERHAFKLVSAPARGETKGPEEAFTAEVQSADGPDHTLDSTSPQIITLTLAVSGAVVETPGSTEVLA